MDLIFDQLKEIFNKNGFRLFMVGGTSRDYLLNKPIDDYDLVSDATPIDIKKILSVDMTFAKYGTVRYKFDNKKIDIITFRVESGYRDSRHPTKITFVKTPEEDYVRRDFTIGAIYIDEKYNVIDPTKRGVQDLKNHELVVIGDPLTRFKEDPLRLLRAKRFIKKYDLHVSDELKKVMHDNLYLLDNLNKDKILEEKKKEDEIGGKKNYEF
jgi:tRNA nucleotidyltransferase (CCA-adding enzyme)